MQALSQLSYNPNLNGGGIRDRTVDPLLAKQMLSQLSYTPIWSCFLSGGAKRDRTVDLLHAMQALSQLSYNPTSSENDAHYTVGNFTVNNFLQKF